MTFSVIIVVYKWAIAGMILVCLVCLVEFLGKQLDEYVTSLPVPTFIERMGTRSGLIRARLRGTWDTIVHTRLAGTLTELYSLSERLVQNCMRVMEFNIVLQCDAADSNYIKFLVVNISKSAYVLFCHFVCRMFVVDEQKY